jgi:hypothetical protein
MENRESVLPGSCIWCGHFALADAILNVLLFTPLGFLLGLRRHAVPLRVWGGLTMLAVLIEVTQILLPGRFPTVSDVLANSAGAALGLLLAGLWKRGFPIHARNSDFFPAAWGFVAATLTIGATALLLPALPNSQWYGQWTPDLGHYDSYGGEVLEARIGEAAAPSHLLPGSSALRLGILSGDTVHIRFVADDGSPGLAPIFSIYDGMQREIFVFGGRGADLVVRIRRLASDIRLRSPQALFAHESPASGDTAMAGVRTSGGAVCLHLSGSHCRSMAPPGRGWSLLLGAAPSPVAEHAADAAWMALLFLPLGYGFRRRTGSYLGCGIALLGFLAATKVSGGLQPIDWSVSGLGVVAGLLIGWWAGRMIPQRFRYRIDRSRPR